MANPDVNELIEKAFTVLGNGPKNLDDVREALKAANQALGLSRYKPDFRHQTEHLRWSCLSSIIDFNIADLRKATHDYLAATKKKERWLVGAAILGVLFTAAQAGIAYLEYIKPTTPVVIQPISSTLPAMKK